MGNTESTLGNMVDNFWKDRPVFVTGASGMVGSCLTHGLLEHGAFIVVLIRDIDPQSELFRSGDISHVHSVNGSLEDGTSVERALVEYDIDTVFHLGAQTQVISANSVPLLTFEANIRGTYLLLNACCRHSNRVRRVLIASSDKVYGQHPSLPYTEETPLCGHYPYDVSKSCVDLLSQSYFHTYNLPVAIARCGNIFGPGDLNWNRLVPGTIRSLYRNERPIVRSNGLYMRDYFYVEDAVSAYMMLAEQLESKQLAGEVFNFSNENPLTVLDMIDQIQFAMGFSITPIIRDEATGEIINQYLSAEKAKKQLGWRYTYNLTGALTETVSWYKGFLHD